MDKERKVEDFTPLKEQLSELLRNEKARGLLNALVLASAIKKEGLDMMNLVCKKNIKDWRLLVLCAVELDVCQKLGEIRENLGNTAPFRMLPGNIHEEVFNSYDNVCEKVQEAEISFGEYFENMGEYGDVLDYLFGDQLQKKENIDFSNKFEELRNLKDSFRRKE